MIKKKEAQHRSKELLFDTDYKIHTDFKEGSIGRNVYLYNLLPVLTGFKTVVQSNVY